MKSHPLFYLLLLLCMSVAAQTPREISLPELKLLYKNLYQNSYADSIAWTNKGTCDPGKIPDHIYSKAENRINFFRLMNRLPRIRITQNKKTEAQGAAFIMHKNEKLHHYIDPSWRCYSKAGADGAKNSCLSLSNHRHHSFLLDFIEDHGNANDAVPHRRWLLYSRSTEFSLGATKNTLALYCTFNLKADTAKTDFIAYPWNGFVPHDLIFPKWSFSIPDIHKVDFSEVKITLTNKSGNMLPLEILASDISSTDPTLTWKVKDLFNEEAGQKNSNELKEKGFIGEEISVKIENVFVDKTLRSYQYKVKITEL